MKYMDLDTNKIYTLEDIKARYDDLVENFPGIWERHFDSGSFDEVMDMLTAPGGGLIQVDQ